jgi:hypothetical protein
MLEITQKTYTIRLKTHEHKIYAQHIPKTPDSFRILYRTFLLLTKFSGLHQRIIKKPFSELTAIFYHQAIPNTLCV